MDILIIKIQTNAHQLVWAHAIIKWLHFNYNPGLDQLMDILIIKIRIDAHQLVQARVITSQQKLNNES